MLTLVGLTLVAGALCWTACSVVLRKVIGPHWVLSLVLFSGVYASAIQQATGFLIPQVALICGVSLLALCPTAVLYSRTALRLFAHPAVLLWLCFLAYATISLAWTSNPVYGTQKLLFFVGLGLVPGIALAALVASNRKFKWAVLLLAALVYAVLFVALGGGVADRGQIEGNNPIWVSRAALFVCAVSLWLQSSSGILRIVVAVVSAGTGLLTASRGPFVSFVIANTIYATRQLVRRKPKTALHAAKAGTNRRARALLTVLAMGGAVALLATSGAMQPQIDRLKTIAVKSDLVEDQNVSERVSLQTAAISRFASSPVFGLGLGSSKRDEGDQYPHSLPLEIASELGTVGLLLFIAALLATVRAAREMPLQQTLLLQAALYSLTSGDLGSNNLLIVCSFWCVGASVAGIDRSGLAWPTAKLRTSRSRARSVSRRWHSEAAASRRAASAETSP